MQTDPVVVEIVTAANLAGIEQAKVGLLGFNASTLGLAAGIGVLAFATESAIKITEAHATALGRVKQASDVTGTSYAGMMLLVNDFIKANQQFIPDNNKAIESFAMLLRSTGNYRTALEGLGVVMNLAAITGKDWDASTQAVNLGLQGSGRALKELGIDIAALKRDQENFTVATKDLTKAKAEVEKATKEHDKAERSLEEYMVQIGRPGHRLTTEEYMRRKDHQDRVTEATKNLQKAHADLATAEDQVKNSAKMQAEVLQQLQEKTKGGADQTSEFVRRQNELNGSFNQMANNYGPAVLALLTLLTGAVNAFYKKLDEIGKDDAMWATISKRLTDIGTGARQLGLNLGIADPAGAEKTKDLNDPFKAVGYNPTTKRYYQSGVLPGGEYVDPISGRIFSATNPQEQSGPSRPVQPGSTGSGWADITAQQNYQIALKQWEETNKAREEARVSSQAQVALASRNQTTLDRIALTLEKKPMGSVNATINVSTADPLAGAQATASYIRGLIVP